MLVNLKCGEEMFWQCQWHFFEHLHSSPPHTTVQSVHEHDHVPYQPMNHAWSWIDWLRIHSMPPPPMMTVSTLSSWHSHSLRPLWSDYIPYCPSCEQGPKPPPPWPPRAGTRPHHLRSSGRPDMRPPPPLKYFRDCVRIPIFSGKGEYFWSKTMV
jgi:hypothetical protein